MTTETETPTVQVTINDHDGCRKSLDIEIPATEVDTARSALVSQYRGSAKLPGFRPGTAPLPLVEKRYRKEIQEDLQDRLLPYGYQNAIRQEHLDVVQVLEVDDIEVEPGLPVRFSVTVDVAPSVDLPSYKGIAIEAESTDVSDEELQAALDEMLDYYGTFEEVTDRAVESGDLVKIDFKADVDGKKPSEVDAEAESLDEREGFWVRADEEAFLPGFGPALAGLSIGDDQDIPVTMDENFVAKGLAGQKVVFSVHVDGIRKKVKPELDEEFFAKIQVESEDQLREQLTSDLKSRKEQNEANRQRDALVKALLDQVKLDLPQSEVERETSNTIQDIVRRNTSQGISEDEIQKHKGEIFQSAEQNARNSVALKYILLRIADEEEIKVGAEEFEAHLNQMANAYRMELDELKSTLKKNDTEDQVRADVRQRKTLDFVLKQAEVTQKN